MAVRWTSTTAEITMDAKALERLVNPHGYNATVVLRVSDEQLPDVLQVLGWPDDRSWVTRGAVKSKKAGKSQPLRGALHFRKGSVNLSGRKPRNGRLPMRALNKDWGTKLYVLGLRLLEGEDAGLELHLAGVRWADIDRVVTEVLHLEPGSWDITSLAQVEWYAALSPPSAQRLAKALGGVPQRGKGSLGRKEFLARWTSHVPSPRVEAVPVHRSTGR